ncbi:hypothetical protein [Halobacterium litoreum]|uniref:Uncharacterized protein n=1 Tax=Halobacterium litoreum TaxID=2039234 RepID=A0ABD5NFI6_9EURY|nr:hypothetical protein [Halobacterium litoreum]UHH13128.1 hypothetical protein LT972_13320 [Halobacterium litoreum]
MTDASETRPDADDDRDDAHLDGVEPGAGCAEIWEHLSERREREEE